MKSIGQCTKHVVIGGGYALLIYKLYLSDTTLTTLPVGTRDVDSLISRNVTSSIEVNISKHLIQAGFKHVFKGRDQPATEAYIKEINNQEIEVEFLTDSLTRGEKSQNVPIAGIVAQPLSYLTLSLRMTKEFRTYSGYTGLVVAPGAWIFHKGLTFTKSKYKNKKLKDLYGIWYLASQLGCFSNQSIEEFKFLASIYSSWAKTFNINIQKWIEEASPEDWLHLEAQDPFGLLTRLKFLRTIKNLY